MIDCQIFFYRQFCINKTYFMFHRLIVDFGAYGNHAGIAGYPSHFINSELDYYRPAIAFINSITETGFNGNRTLKHQIYQSQTRDYYE